jgi:hypothetical protein
MIYFSRARGKAEIIRGLKDGFKIDEILLKVKVEKGLGNFISKSEISNTYYGRA